MKEIFQILSAKQEFSLLFTLFYCRNLRPSQLTDEGRCWVVRPLPNLRFLVSMVLVQAHSLFYISAFYKDSI